MGNCQAIDNASIVIQHPSGRVDKLYSSVPASQIINLNPSHYVAVLLTTTSRSAATTGAPLRITRVKLLRPSDTLLLGHTYRLISAKEVMKESWAKKHAKMQQQQQTAKLISGRDEKTSLHFQHQKLIKHKAIKYDRQRPRKCSSTNCATTRSRWHPSLNSISESSS